MFRIHSRSIFREKSGRAPGMIIGYWPKSTRPPVRRSSELFPLSEKEAPFTPAHSIEQSDVRAGGKVSRGFGLFRRNRSRRYWLTETAHSGGFFCVNVKYRVEFRELQYVPHAPV
jgi:hypothetical protein